MNQRQLNSLNMLKAVTALFTNSENIWIDIQPVNESFSDFQNTVNLIDSIAFKQQNNRTTDYPLHKRQQRIQLVDKTYALAIKLRAYAKKNHNDLLKKSVDFSMSSLELSTDQELINVCQIIHSKGVEYRAQTFDYKITNFALSELQSIIDSYKPMDEQQDTSETEHSVATDDLESLFGFARETLDILDDEVEALIEDETFLSSYHEARKTSDRKRSAELREA